MNRNTFVLTMIFETFFALAAMGLLFSDMGAVIYLISAVVFGVVLAPFFIRLKKETDERKKMKIRRNITLILLVPIVAGLAAIALVVIALFLAFPF